jgi:hypothetical protein
VYLNNKAVYLDGILYQPGAATYEEIKKHMYAMKELGCNLVRIHIAGVDPRIYNLADKMGMLLWVEVPSPHRSSPQSRENHNEELLRMLALIGNHPSVVIWSLYNEDWGAQDIATNPETRQYITDMYHYMQISHPQFLVVDNDGWQHISTKAAEIRPAYGTPVHPDLQRWKNAGPAGSGQIEWRSRVSAGGGRSVFLPRQVPLVVSEWGGFGFADYGGPKDSRRTHRTDPPV